MLHKINFHYFIFQNVLKYARPNLSKVDDVFLYHEHLLFFESMLI